MNEASIRALAWQPPFKVGDTVQWRRESTRGIVTQVGGDRVEVQWSNEKAPMWHECNDVRLDQ